MEGKNVLSLRIGRPIGSVSEPIINPNNLKIEGWHAIDASTKQRAILLTQDIREIVPKGFVVNDHESLTPEGELVRLRDTIKQNFKLIGKTVYEGRRKRLGKVTDFAFERNGLFVQKLHVGQSIIKSFSGGMLIIDRSQITEITDRKIVVKDATVKEGSPAPVIA